MPACVITKPLVRKIQLHKYITITNNPAIAFNNFQNEIKRITIYDGLDKSVDCDVNKNYNIFEKHILIVKNKTMSSKTAKFNKKKHSTCGI